MIRPEAGEEILTALIIAVELFDSASTTAFRLFMTKATRPL
jgi:hypothetical protein